MTSKTFENAVSSIRAAALRRVRRRGQVSAVDVSSVAPGITGDVRGAAVREAFRQLESKGVIARTDDTTYNTATRHRVTVYTEV